MTLFNLLPDRFFNALSGANRKEYADCLLIMFDYLKTGNSFGAEKEELLSMLKAYYEQKGGLLYDNDRVITDACDKASFTLRRLKDCGWLFEEADSDYRIVINFTYYAVPILRTLVELKQEEAMEYLGYLFLIYSAVKNLDQTNLYELLEQIHHNTNIIMNKLKTLHANIKLFLQNLLNKKSTDDLKVIVENLFIDYKNKIIDDSYYRLKTSENISRYRPYIIARLNEMINDDRFLDGAANHLAQCFVFPDAPAAKVKIREMAEYVIACFLNLDKLTEEIDRKNARYIKTSVAKILFIVNNQNDLNGKINTIMKACAKNPNLNLSPLFKLVQVKALSKSSLYTPARKEKHERSEKASLVPIDEKKRQELLKQLFNNNELSLSRINDYVESVLSLRDRLHVTDFPLKDFSDYAKLILVNLYSHSRDARYIIKKTGTYTVKNHFRLPDFNVIKGDYHG